MYKEAPGFRPVPRERRYLVYEEAPGFRPAPRKRKRDFRVWEEAPGFRPGPNVSSHIHQTADHSLTRRAHCLHAPCSLVDIATNKITDFIKYDAGALCMIVGGRNAGRVGVIQRREKHKGSFEIVHVKDAAGHDFATRGRARQLLPATSCHAC